MARRELRWRRFGEPFSELDMVEAELRGGGSRFDDHFWGHVDPDDPSARTDLGCHHERVEPGPGSDINHRSPGWSRPRENGLPTPAKDSTARSGSPSSTCAS